jgi:DNA-binding transcriptional regulator YdaS (Cro superfamily)
MKHKTALARARDTWARVTARRGETTRIARELGMAPQAVHQWTMCPLEWVLDLERLTGIPRHELRPDSALPLATYEYLRTNALQRRAKRQRSTNNTKRKTPTGKQSNTKHQMSSAT